MNKKWEVFNDNFENYEALTFRKKQKRVETENVLGSFLICTK